MGHMCLQICVFKRDGHYDDRWFSLSLHSNAYMLRCMLIHDNLFLGDHLHRHRFFWKRTFLKCSRKKKTCLHETLLKRFSSLHKTDFFLMLLTSILRWKPERPAVWCPLWTGSRFPDLRCRCHRGPQCGPGLTQGPLPSNSSPSLKRRPEWRLLMRSSPGVRAIGRVGRGGGFCDHKLQRHLQGGNHSLNILKITPGGCSLWLCGPGRTLRSERRSCSPLCPASQRGEVCSPRVFPCTCHRRPPHRCRCPSLRSRMHRRQRGPRCRTSTDGRGPPAARSYSCTGQRFPLGSSHSAWKGEQSEEEGIAHTCYSSLNKLSDRICELHVCRVEIPAIKSDDVRVGEGVAVSSRDVVHQHLKWHSNSTYLNERTRTFRTTEKRFSLTLKTKK